MFPMLKKLLKPLFIIWMMSSCISQNEPIKVGYAGELTGKRSKIGVDVRNGVQLAIEEINASGGINGRQLGLLIEDDKGDPETARQVDEKLVNEDVVAIIGHITSGQTAAVFEQMNDAKTVLLSATASSSQFSDKADYFFRVPHTTDAQGIALANYIYDTLNLNQVSGVYDVSNKAFSEVLWEAFVSKYEELGGKVIQAFTFNGSETDLELFTQEVMVTNPSALLIISSDVDTALMAQYIRLQSGTQPVLISSSWASTKELLAKGGQAVEALSIVAVYDSDNPNPAFQEFVQKFTKRFDREPDFGAAYGYEAVQVLAEALKQTGGEAEGLPEALTTIKEFPAIQGNITLNEYGDVERDVYMMVVEDGQFKLVETISSN